MPSLLQPPKQRPQCLEAVLPQLGQVVGCWLVMLEAWMSDKTEMPRTCGLSGVL